MRDAGMDQGRSHFDRTYGSGMVGPPRPHNTGCFRLSRARTFRRLLENIQLRSKKNAAANPKHGTTAESMVAWRCKCGGSWRNDELRYSDGRRKTDEELVIKRNSAFLDHVREFEKNGF